MVNNSECSGCIDFISECIDFISECIDFNSECSDSSESIVNVVSLMSL